MALMKTSAEVSSQKLRGGFYSSAELVRVCLDRIMMLTGERSSLRLLEPSSGDGAFLRELTLHPVGQRVDKVVAVELINDEAMKSKEALRASGLAGEVRTGSYLRLRDRSDVSYDAAVGNPPFLRFQFLDPKDLPSIESLGHELGLPLLGVSNLWIPIFLGALGQLRDGGAFAFIVPAECLTGTSAQLVRAWLVRHTDLLQIDLFPPKSFPGVLQEVVVLSGRRRIDVTPDSKVEVFDHASGESWRHAASDRLKTWTGLLLPPAHLDLLLSLPELPEIRRLGDVAKLSVATVTGANDFFSYDEDTRKQFALHAWSRPLLARVRHAPGLCFDERDRLGNLAQGAPVWLLDAQMAGSDIAKSVGGSAYIALGEKQLLHERYKCRIREPWYRVPVTRPGTLMLSKRSHRYPRLIANHASVVTTDTIYQGSPVGEFVGRERDIVGSFHNSLTLLSAEMFGRSFGGGVLELVPSEVSSLMLPIVQISPATLRRLDGIVRATPSDDERLVEATDALLTRKLPSLDAHVMDTVRDARRLLLGRRMARN